MERSGSQKFLKVISIIDIVIGVLAIIMSIVTITVGGAVGVVSDDVVASGEVTASDVAMASGAMSIIGVFALIVGALILVEGILGLRAANDPNKIMPVWVLSLIGLAGGGVGLVMTIAQSGNVLSSLFSLLGSCLMFWVANNIKHQAGK